MKKFMFLVMAAPLFANSQIPAPLPGTYVNDLSGHLAPGEIQTLNDTIAAIEQRSSVQIAVILMEQLPHNMSIEDYALETGRKWHVGNANNGLVYVVALQDRKQRLEVARALQYQITDLDAMRLTAAMKPGLRSRDYFNALLVLLQGISDELNPVLTEQLALAKEEAEKKGEDNTGWLLSILAAAILSAILTLISGRIKSQKNEREHARRLKKIIDEAAAWECRQMAARKRVDYTDIVGSGLDIGNVAQQTLNLLRQNRLKNARPPDRPAYRPPGNPQNRKQDPGPGYVPDSNTPSYTPPPRTDNTNNGNWGSSSSDSTQSSGSGFDGGGASSDF